MMVLGVRNLAFLELSTAREGWMQVQMRTKKEPGAQTKGGEGLKSEGRGETTYVGLKHTLGVE